MANEDFLNKSELDGETERSEERGDEQGHWLTQHIPLR